MVKISMALDSRVQIVGSSPLVLPIFESEGLPGAREELCPPSCSPVCAKTVCQRICSKLWLFLLGEDPVVDK